MSSVKIASIEWIAPDSLDGRLGGTFRIKLSDGQYLDDVMSVEFSHEAKIAKLEVLLTHDFNMPSKAIGVVDKSLLS